MLQLYKKYILFTQFFKIEILYISTEVNFKEITREKEYKGEQDMYGFETNNGVNNVTRTGYTRQTLNVNQPNHIGPIKLTATPKNESFYPGLSLNNNEDQIQKRIEKFFASEDMKILGEICGIN